MADRRFPTAFKDVPDPDEPGLVLGDDNVVYLIKPDGTRVAIAGGGSPSSLPVADPTGVTIDTTYPNPVTGVGHLTTVVFPADTVAFALAIEGDAFPRVLMLSDPTDQGIMFGDGTVDLYTGQGTSVFVSKNASDGSEVLNLASFHTDMALGTNLDATHRGFVNYSNAPMVMGIDSDAPAISSGVGAPNRGGEVGDFYFRSDPGGANETIYRCTVAGGFLAATWTGIL